ncbi:hypothetical protein BBP40_005675 [Aspergillus hancockii]|nr:hypothetical protein BBP40_005675 [Aspergillus hancockii]
MRIATPVTFAALLAVAAAHPSGAYWGTDDCYTNPDNTENDCSEEQRGGFDWSGLTLGPFSAFAGFQFSGFSFSNSFSGAISGGFSGKCIEGKFSKDSETTLEIASGSDKTFSFSKLHLVTTAEAEVKIIYDMPDGSACKHVAPCSPKGSVVTNDQCGGAISVRFELAEHPKVDDVLLGIEKIEFDCGHGSKTPIPSHHNPSPSKTPTPPKTVHSSTPLIPGPSSSGAVTSPAPSTPVKMTTSTVYTTSLITITSCAPTVTNCPGDSTTVVTSTIAVSTTVCPVTPTETSGKPTGTPGKPTGSSPVGGSSSGASSSAPTGTFTGVPPSGTEGPSSSVPAGSTTTVVTWETLTTCPVTTTATSGGVTTTSVYSTVSTVTLTSTATVCNKCTATPPTAVPPTGTPTPTGVSPELPPKETTTTVVTYTTVTDCPVTTTATAGGSTTTSVYTTQSTVTLTSTATVCPKCSATPTPSGVKPITTPGQGATTVVTYETVTTCPVTSTITAGGSTTTTVFTTVSTLTKTSTGVSPIHSSSAPSSPAPAPETPCPNTVPKCINTWLPLLPKCTSNGDPGCFCPSHEFTDKVISCIQAWGASKEEVQSALSYFTGICAPYVPGNPGIVTGIPSTITLIPTPAPAGVQPIGTGDGPKPTAAPSVPCTTISYSTYTVTVPQVGFSTGTSGHSTTVGLVPGPAPTGVSPGRSSGIPNPWASPSSSTLIPSNRPSSTARPSATYTPPPLANTASTGTVFTSFWLAMGVAAIFGVFL